MRAARQLKFFYVLLMTAGIAMGSVTNSEQQALFTFDSTESGRWTAVNDTVMGGRSAGAPEIRNGVLHFSGTLSLENNGGFSSIRHATDLDLSGRTGIRLRVLGDGRPYQLRLHTDTRYRGRPVAYGATFPTDAGQWLVTDVPFDRLVPSFRGRQLDGYQFDPSRIELIGILLGDKQPGPFQLQIDRIAAY